MTLNDHTASLQVDFTGRTMVVTGGTGVLGREIVSCLASCGANVAILTRDESRGKNIIDGIGPTRGRLCAINADVIDKGSLERALGRVSAEFGEFDTLINGAGGNSPAATTNPQTSFFQLKEADISNVTGMNMLGTILASQVFGEPMADRKKGVILNITSMTAERPLTRVVAYSAAKAAIVNFTQWLAVHMAQEYSPEIRVNAVAPGFFLTEQNRFLLTDKATGDLTDRGKKIIAHTPMARFGRPEDLLGAVLWLLSPGANFVTGIVVPVDGGFSAFSGV